MPHHPRAAFQRGALSRAVGPMTHPVPRFSPPPSAIGLRDWFAGQALVGLFAARPFDRGPSRDPARQSSAQALAADAYAIADALVEQAAS